MSPVDPSKLPKVLDAIRKVYTDGVIYGDEKPTIGRVPTGSLELDYAIGGGVPIGRWCHFFGGKGSAKTLTAWKIIAEAQKMGMDCAYYNIEKQYDDTWCKRQGIDTSKLLLVEGTQIEQVGAKLESLLGAVHLHVIDSIALAISIEELGMKAEEWRPGISARAWGKILRRANERFDDTQNTVIMINQTRNSFGYGGSEEATGGKQIEYISRLSLHFRRSSWLYYDKNGILSPDATAGDSLTGDKEPDGIEYQARVVKTNGFGQPDRTARLRLDYRSGEYDELWTLVKAAKYNNLVEQKGSWFEFPDGTKGQGEGALRAYIETNPDFSNEIRKAMIA